MIQAKINKSWYQKTKISNDGITQVVIPDLVYTNYEVDINKIYFIEDKIEMLKQLRSDLEQLCNELDIEIGNEYKKQLKRGN